MKITYERKSQVKNIKIVILLNIFDLFKIEYIESIDFFKKII